MESATCLSKCIYNRWSVHDLYRYAKPLADVHGFIGSCGRLCDPRNEKEKYLTFIRGNGDLLRFHRREQMIRYCHKTKQYMQKRLHSILGLIFTVLFAQGQTVESDPQTFKDMAAVTLDSIYVHYGVPDESLLRETYPFDASHKATYLAEESQGDQRPNQYSYLWPFSGSLSAQVARYEMENAPDILEQIEQRVLPGLNAYYDKRVPHGYASYIQSAPQSDRFYDDNVWLGIDFTDLYIQSGNQKYLTKAKEIWEFVASGMDAKLGGGIYWYEQHKTSKNTCSNAPGVVFLVKLHQATNETDYLTQAIALYEWTKTHLSDPEDGLYWDNIKLDGQVDERKYPYNSGQMLQAATLLYQVTGEDKYLEEAQEIAESGHNFFFYPPGEHHSGDFRL